MSSCSKVEKSCICARCAHNRHIAQSTASVDKMIKTAQTPLEMSRLLEQFRIDMGLTAAPETKAPAPVKKTMREIVVEACRADNEHRRRGASGDLFTEISPAQLPEDESIPILRPSGRVLNANAAGFDKEAKIAFDCFSEFDMTGMVVAGGAVSSVLTGQEINDIDVFLVGLTNAQCMTKIQALAAHLADYWKKSGNTMMVYRTERCISFRKGEHVAVMHPVPITQSVGTQMQTLIIPTISAAAFLVFTTNKVIQVVFARPYNTISEVLHGFDLGSSAVAWDGKKVYYSSLGKLAFEYGVNVLDLTRRRPSYEHRIEKYFQRGFSLVLPDLDTTTIRAEMKLAAETYLYHTAIDLGFMIATLPGRSVLRTVSGPVLDESPPNIFKCIALAVPEKPDAKRADMQPTSNYGSGIPYEYLDTIGVNNFKVARKTPVNAAALCAFAQWTPGIDLFGIKVSFNGLAMRIAEYSKRKSIQLEQLENLVGPSVAKSLAALVAEGKEIDFTMLADQLAKAVETRAVIPFQFHPVEEGSALITEGVFRIEPTTLAEWYGKYQAPAQAP